MDLSTSSAAPAFHRMRRNTFNWHLNDIKDSVMKNKKMYSLIALLLFGFYWFQIRPIQINRGCAETASANARQLLVSKVALAADPEQQAAYQSMVDKSMYLRTDYESFYIKCLRNEGVNVWGVAN